MSDALINIVAVPDRPGAARWQAVASRGSVAGEAGLRPILPPAAPGAELSLYVQQRWRRHGIGSRLLATLREHTTERRLVVDVAPGSPGEAFGRRHGFRHSGSTRQDLLAYGDVHVAWLGELVDAEHPGYRLTHWAGDLPSHAGNAVLTAADSDGDLAAYVLAVAGVLPQPRARQYGPAVLPGHHGRRLGLWVTAALIQRLREVHPHVQEIESSTAEDDSELLVVRKQLGFRPLRRTRRYELTLP
jgi:GNAT superfamily N-acetyltransferase